VRVVIQTKKKKKPPSEKDDTIHEMTILHSGERGPAGKLARIQSEQKGGEGSEENLSGGGRKERVLRDGKASFSGSF